MVLYSKYAHDEADLINKAQVSLSADYGFTDDEASFFGLICTQASISLRRIWVDEGRLLSYIKVFIGAQTTELTSCVSMLHGGTDPDIETTETDAATDKDIIAARKHTVGARTDTNTTDPYVDKVTDETFFGTLGTPVEEPSKKTTSDIPQHKTTLGVGQQITDEQGYTDQHDIGKRKTTVSRRSTDRAALEAATTAKSRIFGILVTALNAARDAAELR